MYIYVLLCVHDTDQSITLLLLITLASPMHAIVLRPAHHHCGTLQSSVKPPF